MIAQYWGGSIFNWMWQMGRRRGGAHFLCDTIHGGMTDDRWAMLFVSCLILCCLADVKCAMRSLGRYALQIDGPELMLDMHETALDTSGGG